MERNTREPKSLRLTPRCGAKRRDGLPCQKPRAKGRNRCRLHGGAPGSGAPRGEANGRYSHGLLTAQAIEERNALLEITVTRRISAPFLQLAIHSSRTITSQGARQMGLIAKP
jgi:glucans biosynthesis protein